MEEVKIKMENERELYPIYDRQGNVVAEIKEEANKRIKKNNGNPYKNLSIDKYI